MENIKCLECGQKMIKIQQTLNYNCQNPKCDEYLKEKFKTDNSSQIK
jgi:hypothetical protein